MYSGIHTHTHTHDTYTHSHITVQNLQRYIYLMVFYEVTLWYFRILLFVVDILIFLFLVNFIWLEMSEFIWKHKDLLYIYYISIIKRNTHVVTLTFFYAVSVALFPFTLSLSLPLSEVCLVEFMYWIDCLTRLCETKIIIIIMKWFLSLINPLLSFYKHLLKTI